MPASTPGSARFTDRAGYVWLAVAAVLFSFAAGRWAVPMAAWLAPLFLLRYIRTQRPVRGLVVAWLLRCTVAAVIVLPGTVDVSGARYYLSALVIVSGAMLPYVADRLIATRLQGFAATLVFPSAFTTLEYLASFGPTGTINSIANSQYGDLPLVQVVSVTGIWGLTFLITWFAAVANQVWEHGSARPRAGTAAAVYAGVLTVVLLGGGARLALARPDAGSVRVAGVSASRAAARAGQAQLPAAAVNALQAGTATPEQRAAARAAFAVLDDDLLARSRQQAQAGAKIVTWPEASPVGAGVLLEDEPALLRQATALARQQDIYLDLGLGVFLPSTQRPPYLRDEAILIAPSGQVVWTYEKTHLIPFTEQGLVVPGTGKAPVTDTPYGRLTNVICFDQDFPAMMRRAGQARADLVLAPSDDWRGIDPAHAEDAAFRAVENGYSLLRPASQGLSLAVDYEGHVLAESDYYATDTQVVAADLPTRGAHTIYARIGDLFAWLSAGSVVALTALALRATVSRKPVRPADVHRGASTTSAAT